MEEFDDVPELVQVKAFGKGCGRKGNASGKQSAEYGKGLGHGLRPEKNAGEAVIAEGKQCSCRRGWNRLRVVLTVELPGTGDDVKDALCRSPGHKGPAGAVPDAAQQENEDQVRVHAGSALPVPAKGNVYILAEKTAQCDVPPSPEFDDIDRLIGGVEVYRDFHSKHPRQPAGHITVAAEVKIELDGIKENEKQAVHRGKGRNVGISPVHRQTEGIRHQHFFHHTEGEQVDTRGEFLRIRFLLPDLRELRQHLALADNGPGNQLGKKGNEKRVVKKGAVFHLAAVGIHHEANLLEGEKADSQRKQNPLQHEGGSKDRVHVFHKKVIIFEIEQDRQIARHTQNHHRPAPSGTFFLHKLHPSENRIVEQNAACHDQQIAGIEITVKPQRKACQPQSGRHAFSPV